jgi:hypothetical protein
MRGAGTFLTIAVSTVVVSALLPLPLSKGQKVEILRESDSMAPAYNDQQPLSSFQEENVASVSTLDALPTVESTPIPQPSPTPTPALYIVTLAWDPSPDSTVTGYRLLMGTQSHTYVAKITLAKQTSVRVVINHPVTYFVVTAYNAAGTESLPSGEIVYLR